MEAAPAAEALTMECFKLGLKVTLESGKVEMERMERCRFSVRGLKAVGEGEWESDGDLGRERSRREGVVVRAMEAMTWDGIWCG